MDQNLPIGKSTHSSLTASNTSDPSNHINGNYATGIETIIMIQHVDDFWWLFLYCKNVIFIDQVDSVNLNYCDSQYDQNGGILCDGDNEIEIVLANSLTSPASEGAKDDEK